MVLSAKRSSCFGVLFGLVKDLFVKPNLAGRPCSMGFLRLGDEKPPPDPLPTDRRTDCLWTLRPKEILASNGERRERGNPLLCPIEGVRTGLLGRGRVEREP